VEQLDNLIDNFRRHNIISDPDFPRLLEERERREGHGLNFETTRLAIWRAAVKRSFISYKDIADESGAIWSKVHYHMGEHLTRLCEYGHRQHWPLITSIVVNKDLLDTGDLKPESLSGFVTVARNLGYLVTDEEAFLREQQERTFAWAEMPVAALL
jgi:5-methylcytosine-specific restriction protein B